MHSHTSTPTKLALMDVRLPKALSVFPKYVLLLIYSLPPSYVWYFRVNVHPKVNVLIQVLYVNQSIAYVTLLVASSVMFDITCKVQTLFIVEWRKCAWCHCHLHATVVAVCVQISFRNDKLTITSQRGNVYVRNTYHNGKSTGLLLVTDNFCFWKCVQLQDSWSFRKCRCHLCAAEHFLKWTALVVSLISNRVLISL
jgi:hypothetical protein